MTNFTRLSFYTLLLSVFCIFSANSAFAFFNLSKPCSTQNSCYDKYRECLIAAEEEEDACKIRCRKLYNSGGRSRAGEATCKRRCEVNHDGNLRKCDDRYYIDLCIIDSKTINSYDSYYLGDYYLNELCGDWFL